MTTQTAPALTPKQRQVREMLSEGMSVADIAKKLKISTSGVYGHMRNMRAAGVVLANGHEAAAPDVTAVPDATPPSVAPALVATNGHVDPEQALESAVSACQERSREIDQQVTELHATIQQFEAERAELEERAQKYEAALAALA